MMEKMIIFALIGAIFMVVSARPGRPFYRALSYFDESLRRDPIDCPSQWAEWGKKICDDVCDHKLNFWRDEEDELNRCLGEWYEDGTKMGYLGECYKTCLAANKGSDSRDYLKDLINLQDRKEYLNDNVVSARPGRPFYRALSYFDESLRRRDSVDCSSQWAEWKKKICDDLCDHKLNFWRDEEDELNRCLGEWYEDGTKMGYLGECYKTCQKAKQGSRDYRADLKLTNNRIYHDYPMVERYNRDSKKVAIHEPFEMMEMKDAWAK